jgi:hypothetical protein
VGPPVRRPGDVPPPWAGTIFVAPGIVTDDDETRFRGQRALGQDYRYMYDRRTDSWSWVRVQLFAARYADTDDLEMQVHPEIPAAQAAGWAGRYAEAVGRLPLVLRRRLPSVGILPGTAAFGGGQDSLTVHTGQREDYEAEGILHEALFNETTHILLDPRYLLDEAYQAVVASDVTAVSEYAQQHPKREDVAETFLMCAALRRRPDRLPAGVAETLLACIPGRIAFFDALDLEYAPL